ncbi:hypothetical protein MTO96_046262, partial [Rhipicephalus appendiculatus]
MAYKLLARNQPVPDHISMAAQGTGSSQGTPQGSPQPGPPYMHRPPGAPSPSMRPSPQPAPPMGAGGPPQQYGPTGGQGTGVGVPAAMGPQYGPVAPTSGGCRPSRSAAPSSARPAPPHPMMGSQGGGAPTPPPQGAGAGPPGEGCPCSKVPSSGMPGAASKREGESWNGTTIFDASYDA